MNEPSPGMAADRNAKPRKLLAGYSDLIRLSDVKADIAAIPIPGI